MNDAFLEYREHFDRLYDSGLFSNFYYRLINDIYLFNNLILKIDLNYCPYETQLSKI